MGGKLLLRRVFRNGPNAGHTGPRSPLRQKTSNKKPRFQAASGGGVTRCHVTFSRVARPNARPRRASGENASPAPGALPKTGRAAFWLFRATARAAFWSSPADAGDGGEPGARGAAGWDRGERAAPVSGACIARQRRRGGEAGEPGRGKSPRSAAGRGGFERGSCPPVVGWRSAAASGRHDGAGVRAGGPGLRG